MKINLGCGSDLKEHFINIDIRNISNNQYIKHNLIDGLPIEINNVEFIYSSHFFEHLDNNQAIKLLTECYAVAKKGCIIRLALPNYKLCFENYCNGNKDYFNIISKHAPNNLMTEYLEYAVYQYGQHKSIWDVEKCQFYLSQVGFKNIKESEFNPKYDIKDEIRTKYTFYTQGIK